ncbi:MAG TPA: hypothetical protein VFF60_07230, partial [Candidatus Binatus sp.]|nr:hypothetical protein [Candidatus Binatus sp.]
MRRAGFFIIYIAAVVSAAAIGLGAGCAGQGGTTTNPSNPTPAPIPADNYYVNAGTNLNNVYGLTTSTIGVSGTPSPLNNSPYSTGANGGSGAPFGITL